MTDTLEEDQIYEAVREHYAGRASQAAASPECCGPAGACCSPNYSDMTLVSLPATVTGLSLGCGDPVSQADIREGDTVLDLGSGGGIDCFLAAKRAGPSGRVIGVDMTGEMLEKARANAGKLNAVNVEFREGRIEALPVDDASVDVLISNCVINLSPDKPTVFREIYRVLKPGGRVSVSDMVIRGAVPSEMKGDLSAWAACLAGAIDVREYVQGLEEAGLVEVEARPRDALHGVLASIPFGTPFSALISAKKPM